MIHFHSKSRSRSFTALAVGLIPFLSLVASAKGLNPTELKNQALQVLETNCVACHGPDKQKGKVRLDVLETIDPVDLQNLFAEMKEAVHFKDMPPEEAEKQPSDAERKVLMQWLESQLTGDTARALAEKLKRFEYGNVVDHEDLFSGEYADRSASTPDRRWIISEFIFNEKVNRLLDYHPTRTIYGKNFEVRGDSGIHWSPKSERGNKFRRTISNPFLLPKKVGVRYSAHEALTAGHLLTMIGNAKRIAGHMSSEATMKAHYPAMFSLMETEFGHRETLRRREAFLTTYTHMEHLLREIYGDKHESLLPAVTHLEVPYPQPETRNGKVRLETNLGLLGRQDQIDLTAIYRGLNAYRTEESDYEEVIAQSERDWFMEGVVESRIQNRVALMKSLQVCWDMTKIYEKASGHQYSRPEYQPLDDAEMAVIVAAVKKHRKKGDTYQDIINKCRAEWETSFEAGRKRMPEPDDELLGGLVTELYERIYERTPDSEELAKNIAVLRSFLAKVERQDALAKLIESLILNTGFVYRNEFGQGEADEHGRRMLSPRDASFALAYALTDSSPDAELVKAASEGRLNTREDYEREVRRMLGRRDLWTIVDESVQAMNLNASVTNQPIRKLRFFREFFGYPTALSLFKDDERFGAGRHEPAVSRLIDEADLLVEHILEGDQKVFEKLLTTEKFYVFHNGDNDSVQAAAATYKDTYDHFKDLDWENFTPEDFGPHITFLQSKGVKELRDLSPDKMPAMLKRFMKTAERQFGAGQKNGVPFMWSNYGFWHGGPVLTRTGQQMRGHEVTSYWNIDWRSWDYPTQQPAKIPNRKGLLTHPAWLIAHARNLETDPIHRGKWVREKLLAGTIPDVPITVDAVIPPDHTMTLRQRMEDRTGDEYCWRCHQKMDPLGFPLESYDDFGRFRLKENLEHPDNLIAKASKAHLSNAPDEDLTFGAKLPVYKTLPVDPRGVLKGTDDPALDGKVTGAFEMIDKLAASDKVRQSIIRHAFRYFMGRNETLADSKTLIDAEKAYLNSKGSFDEVIVSFLTSDSFIFRKPTEKQSL